MAPIPSLATCFELIRETDAHFEAFIQCTHTLGEPKYEITYHYFGDNFVGLFFFDRRGARLVCNAYEFDGKITRDCRTSSLRGVPRQYENKNRIIKMINLDVEEIEKLENIYKNVDIFKYPDTLHEVSIENCFVAVKNKNEILMGYRNNTQFMDLSYCLIEYERFIAENYIIMCFWTTISLIERLIDDATNNFSK